MTAAEIFDTLAPTYDETWTNAAIGRLQREAFWKHAAPYLEHTPRVLDLGCGTGEDALRLMRAGISVTAIDASAEMVAVARSRGIDARVLPIEETNRLDQQFDVVVSNFGALNCVADLKKVPFARLVKPGGYALLCLLSRFCFWETIWFMLHANARGATRRWGGNTTTRSGLRVFYPGAAGILSSEFTLIARVGIGITVPPSYVRAIPDRVLQAAAHLDDRISTKPFFRSIADHTLVVFKRS